MELYTIRQFNEPVSHEAIVGMGEAYSAVLSATSITLPLNSSANSRRVAPAVGSGVTAFHEAPPSREHVGSPPGYFLSTVYLLQPIDF